MTSRLTYVNHELPRGRRSPHVPRRGRSFPNMRTLFSCAGLVMVVVFGCTLVTDTAGASGTAGSKTSFTKHADSIICPSFSKIRSDFASIRVATTYASATGNVTAKTLTGSLGNISSTSGRMLKSLKALSPPNTEREKVATLYKHLAKYETTFKKMEAAAKAHDTKLFNTLSKSANKIKLTKDVVAVGLECKYGVTPVTGETSPLNGTATTTSHTPTKATSTSTGSATSFTSTGSTTTSFTSTRGT